MSYSKNPGDYVIGQVVKHMGSWFGIDDPIDKRVVQDTSTSQRGYVHVSAPPTESEAEALSRVEAAIRQGRVSYR